MKTNWLGLLAGVCAPKCQDGQNACC